MSLDGSSIARVSSPAKSGRSSPNPHAKLKEDDDLLRKDKSFRRYAATVERVLAQFAAVEEWADYISFLSRLLKALQGKPSGYAEIPHKYLVAKRLSQCLNPVLPSGVHQKTLEVYAFIFSAIGRDGLANNLNLYLPGLAPTLAFASLSVKPSVLSLFESYVVKLNAAALRPALKALILALLPSLEEENSEEFEWTLRILDGLKAAVSGGIGSGAASQQYFWQCLFLASITSSSRRPGALAYLMRNLPPLALPKSFEAPTTLPKSPTKRQSEEDIKLQDAVLAVASPEPGLLIRCFCTGLRDNQLLIQRGFLDLLVTHLPLHSPVLQKNAVQDDLRKLISAASSVVARRDMSLNRRLWSWFLGPEPSPEAIGAMSPTSPRSTGQLTPRQDILAAQSRYFEHNGLSALAGTIRSMIVNEPQDAAERSRPLRVCLSLMDRWEIGSLIVPQIFLPALQSAWHYQKLTVSKDSRAEVLKSANMFFDAVESSLIWAELAKLVAQALAFDSSTVSQSKDILEFVLFIINNFNVREEEMQIVHMPLVSIFALIRLRNLIRQPRSFESSNLDIFTTTLQIVNKLLELIPTRVLKAESVQEGNAATRLSPALENDILANIERFYTRDQGNIDAKRPLAEKEVGSILLSCAFDLLAPQLQGNGTTSIVSMDLTTSILSLMIRKGPRLIPDINSFVAVFQDGSDRMLGKEGLMHNFSITSARVLSLETIFSSPHSAAWMPTRTIRKCIPSLVADLWPGLSPSCLKHNVEAARCLWKLQTVGNDDRLIESTLSTLMTANSSQGLEGDIDLESARRFATLWAHSQTSPTGSHSRRGSLLPTKGQPAKPSSNSDISMLERPLMVLLDTLELTKSATSIFVVNWLQSLPTISPILELLTSRLTSTPLIANAISNSSDDPRINDDLQDATMSLFYFQRLLHLIDIQTATVWQALRSSPASNTEMHSPSIHDLLCRVCMQVLNLQTPVSGESELGFSIKQSALSLLGLFFSGPLANTLSDKELELPLLDKLAESIRDAEHTLQTSIMDVLLPALRMRVPEPGPPLPARRERKVSRDLKAPTLQITTDEGEIQNRSSDALSVPPALLDCLLLGMKSPKCRPVLENWVIFLGKCLPLYEGSIFQILLPLVECFSHTLNDVLKDIQGLFVTTDPPTVSVSEPTAALLLNGLEQTLAAAHDYLEIEEAGATPIKSPEQQQSGFFGNMVSGVFANETAQSRSKTANKRLTVLLCFKDAIRICFRLWSWGDSGKETSLRDMSAAASFNYITLRLRNRTRRLFEHLFAVEPLECLETLIDLWQRSTSRDNDGNQNVVLNLLNALENSRPKNTIPAIFDAIYSRTNPNALDPSRKSTLTSDITDVSLAGFLVTYARSLEDDAMDEIWPDCSTFLKDVLANPMPHRQTLYRLLEFTAVLGGKVDNTNFGEQRRMRRELGDLFNKLLTATLTIRPIGASMDGLSAPTNEKSSASPTPTRSSFDVYGPLGPDDLVSILATIAPDLPKILIESDRISHTAGTISTQVLLPTFRSKAFPSNVSKRTLHLMKALAGIAEASRASKKDVTEAFNDARFFSTSTDLVKDGWLPVLRSWVLADKERLPELLSRLSPPTAAGFLGVGATSARLEADRRTQLNLRRIATLTLACPNDAFVVHLGITLEKVVDLLTATSTSSPSTTTRAEIYMVLRALLVKTSVIHLSSFWPTINSELFDALASAYPTENGESMTPACILQACKLLDTLLVLGLDDFQMQEWLFISDTTDAVYRPHELQSVALVDDLAESLDEESGGVSASSNYVPAADTSGGKRKPLLTATVTKDVPQQQLVMRVVRPFLRQLSIQAFESTYGMLTPDLEACFEDLVQDLFDDSTLV